MRGPYIAGPFYDAVMFIGAPLLALGLGIAISGTPLADEEIELWGRHGTATSFFIGSFIFAHLGLVFVRSHLNRQIFARHPRRFVAVPLVLLFLLCASDWLLATAIVLTVWWDVVHSSLQTFGLGRIYDARRGNPADAGRRLDLGLNLLLYVGPILAGATLLEHLQPFAAFEHVGATGVREIPIFAEAHQATWAPALLVGGALYLLVYVLAYVRLHRRGYRVSPQKVALLVFTGACSIYTWGFNSFGEAFFIMNFFHAWQYFGLVWWSERGNLRERLGLARARWGGAVALAAMLLAAGAYGVWAELVDSSEQRVALSVTLVVSLMHFWYDGFIWSVRRREV
ncbi:hypothetical protein SAMN02745121_05077 [Nannocystis exedens]|uniref:Uncharacterized protein n=1 Tax=Nannocystis exedens TaxID=54 RepID=A0A1I2CDS1_9BACT|nr:hypothetical protein [Nannocystis exedens]PCC68356.1 hypothetical protein NAEX_01366 [Nannocystis exedens]SFE66342.1 hypothetical protein SAMN02745121_05077 [Nannocystis exedens]